MSSDSRNTNSIQTWVEVINSSTPTKEEKMQDAPKMSERAADTVFGQPTNTNDFDRDLYELQKLADQVLAAVAASEAQDMAFREAKAALAYDRPKLEFTLPMPPWPGS